MTERSDSSRRDFLTGRAAGRAASQVASDAVERMADKIGQAAKGLFPQETETPALESSYVVTLQRRAMACNFEVRLNALPQQQGDETAAALEALDLIDQLESQLTTYRSSSEIIEINQQAPTEPVEVEAQLFELLQYADQLYRESAGAFDLTSGPLSQAWGFDQRAGRLPSEEELAAALARVGWDKVTLTPANRSIEFGEPGVEINVHSIGKGYALDRAASHLQQLGVDNFLLHGGRSTLVARGDRFGEQGWATGLRHPLRPQERLAQFSLNDQALSTSGSATQSFCYRGKQYGHLLDPRTGWPAEELYSATVIAPTAMEADALSTAFYVMGAEKTAAYCGNRPEIQALLVLPAKKAGEVELREINF